MAARGSALLLCGLALASGQAAAAASTVVLDDAELRVVQHVLAPGESEPAAAHGCRVSYALNDHNVVVTSAGGTAQTFGHRFRSAWWRPAETVALTNPGAQPIKTLVFEFKGALPGVRGCGPTTPPKVEAAAGPDHATRIAAGAHRVIFENAALRLIEANLPGGGAAPAHALGCRVSYALTEQALRVTHADGAIEEVRHPLSSTWWRPAETVALANLGRGNAFRLVLELKHKPAGDPTCPPARNAAP